MSRAMKIFYSLLAITVMSGMSALAAEDPALEKVRTKMNVMFQEIGPEHINTSPVDGWYTVQKDSVVAYVSEDGRYLLQGDMIDLDNQINLSEVTRTDSRRDLMSSVKEDQFILFTPEVVKHRVIIFTDIDCTYCRKLHSQIDEYLAAGIEIRYMLYPRNGPASRSWNTSEDVWCARDRSAALTAAKLDRSFDTNKCDMSAISEQYMLGQSVGLTGTPAIVFENGTLVSGYLPPEVLVSRLQMLGPIAATTK
ncbi:MAG: DsbC family protein [Gammaproteobacteria bacterium]|jgi:thiol:disulfide interchange protein DsbC|nr:DsbC family protein [Gammaproteobacteria bacterium]